MTQRIYYLKPQYVEDYIDPENTDNLHELIKLHPDVQIFTPIEFMITCRQGKVSPDGLFITELITEKKKSDDTDRIAS